MHADADMIEFDIRLTRDHIPVLSHNLHLYGTRKRELALLRRYTLAELQRLADRVAIIDRGQLQRIVEPRAALSAALPYRISIVGDERVLREIFPAAEVRGPGDFELPGVELRTLNAGIAELLRRGVLVSNLHPAHSVLEQHFRQAVGE